MYSDCVNDKATGGGGGMPPLCLFLELFHFLFFYPLYNDQFILCGRFLFPKVLFSSFL